MDSFKNWWGIIFMDCKKKNIFEQLILIILGWMNIFENNKSFNNQV